MSASVQSADLVAAPAPRRLARLRQLDIVGLIITLATLMGAIVWAFPLYWGLITTFKQEYEIVRPGVQLWPEHFTFENYVHVLLADQDRLLVHQFARHLGARSRSSS